MNTDSNWFNSADSVRPDYRAGNGGRPPSDRRPASWTPPSPPGVPASWPTPSNPGTASPGPAPSYPIVAQHELDDPDRRGPLGLIKRRRLEDIPKIKPHE